MPALTDKDREDVPRAIDLGADLIAQSFVRQAEDITELRALLGDPRGIASPGIVAKIETRAATLDVERILVAADEIMVARGDLGVEIPFEEVPIVQKRLLRAARRAGVPAMVATQMLESMTDAPRPTRAEASDVANAVLDGATAVLLSAETAIGRYPVEAAEAAVRICRYAEEHGAPYRMPPR
jgi:pyruvate kinase